MLRKYSLQIIGLLLLLFSAGKASAQADPIEHTWYNEHKTAKVQIYKARDGKFYGKLVWLREPNRDGKPKLDIHNSKESARTQPLMGMLLLKGFKKDGSSEYNGGTIYDPKNGKTYSSKMELNGNTLDVRGYIGISLIGRSETWTRAD